MIKKIFATAMVATAFAAHADTFHYSFATTSDFTISGSFDGTASGDLVTGLTNISVNATYLGNPLSGGETMVDYRFDALVNDWVSGGAVASFSGAQNNFAFIAPGISTFIRPSTPPYTYSIGYSVNGSTVYFFSSYDQQANSNWTLTNVSAVPEPEAYALLLAGLGWVAGVVRRRKLAPTT